MRQRAGPVRVLDYARPRSRFGIHPAAAIAAGVIVLALNLWPHFVTTVMPNMADMPEPELGWPWVFFFYGQTYSGYGPWLIPKHLAYDLLLAVLIVMGAGHAVWRITRHCTGPESRESS